MFSDERNIQEFLCKTAIDHDLYLYYVGGSKRKKENEESGNSYDFVSREDEKMAQRGYLYKTETKTISRTTKEYTKDKWENQVYEWGHKNDFEDRSVRHKVYEEVEYQYFHYKLWYKFFRNKKECESNIELEHELYQKITKKEWKQFNYYYNYEKEKSDSVMESDYFSA